MHHGKQRGREWPSTMGPMPTQTAPTIDPSARVDPSAVIADDAIIEADAIIGPDVTIGARTRVRTRAIIVENTTIGAGCDIHPYAVLGGDPQDYAFDPTKDRGTLIIGDNNIIREGVTFSRSTGGGPPTRIGSGNYFMCQSHIGHNALVGDHCVLANAAALAGHAHLGNRCVLSACSFVHQFTDVGDGVMFQGCSGAAMHVPPFVMMADANIIVGLNRVGLRRAGFSAEEREDVKQAFRAVYRIRGARPLVDTILELKSRRQWQAPAQYFLDFILDHTACERPRNRGVCGHARHDPR